MDRTRPAVLALLGLAASALVLSPEPPPDRLLAAIAAFIGARPERAAAILEAAFAISAGAGAAVLVILVVVRILDILGIKGARDTGRGRRRSWAASFAAYALFLIVLAVARRGGARVEGNGTGRAAAPGGAGTGYALPAAASPAQDLVSSAPFPPFPPFLPLAAGGALAAGVIVLAALHSRRRRRVASAPIGPDREDEDLPDDSATVLAIAESRRRLELGGQVREAIVACYAEMCGIFEGLGSGRSPKRNPEIERYVLGGAIAARSLTAREFAARLRSKGAGEPEISVLTSIFEKARYSNEDCFEDDRLSAIRALEALEIRYGRGGA